MTTIPLSDHWALIGYMERKLRHIVISSADRSDITADELDRLEEIREDLYRMLCVS